jgi:serine acetyltransferase
MVNLVLAVLPGWLHARVRRMVGHDISPAAQVGFGAVLQVGRLTMGPGARIGSFSRIRAERATLGAEAKVSSLCTIAANEFELGEKSTISPMVIVSGDPQQSRSRLVIGRHSKVFPISWLDCDYGITMGDRVGVGGHGLIFTQGRGPIVSSALR